MTKEIKLSRKNSLVIRITLLNLLLFLTGALLGCLIIYLGCVSCVFHESMFSNELSNFLEVCLANGKFLILLYLFAFMRHGAMLVPTVFGLEGILMGATAFAFAGAGGYSGIFLLAIMLIFRLILILPYSFLLGTWSVRQSLAFECATTDKQIRITVLLLTLFVVIVASFLECTVAQWLVRIYYLKVGV